MNIENSRYIPWDRNYLSNGTVMTTLSHTDTGNKVSFSKAHKEEDLFEIFQEFLDKSKLNQKNTFTYVPANQRAFLVEFAVFGNPHSKPSPKLLSLCLGSEKATLSKAEISCEESYLSHVIRFLSDAPSPDPEAEDFLDQVLSAREIEDLPKDLQEGLHVISDLNTAEDLLLDPLPGEPRLTNQDLLSLFQELFRSLMNEMCTLKIRTHEENCPRTYTLSEKNNLGNYSTKPFFFPKDYTKSSYRKITTVAPLEQEDVTKVQVEAHKTNPKILSQATLERINQLLDNHIELLKLEIPDPI